MHEYLIKKIHSKCMIRSRNRLKFEWKRCLKILNIEQKLNYHKNNERIFLVFSKKMIK